MVIIIKLDVLGNLKQILNTTNKRVVQKQDSATDVGEIIYILRV